jgi:hypothetical protein
VLDDELTRPQVPPHVGVAERSKAEGAVPENQGDDRHVKRRARTRAAYGILSGRWCLFFDGWAD